MTTEPAAPAAPATPAQADSAVQAVPPADGWTPPAWFILPAFAVAAFLMTFRDPTRLATAIVGDNGDAMLLMWVLRWVQHTLPDGWTQLWNADIYWPNTNTLAYSESMLPVALVHWPLQAVFGPVLAYNLIFLGAWTGSLWFTYRLALRLTASWGASIVAAFVFSFATPRLARTPSLQLVMGFLVPLIVLQLVQLFDRPRWWRGALLGLSLAVLTLSASYYGVIVGTAIVLLPVGYLVLIRPHEWKPYAVALATGAAVAVLLTGPVVLQYVKLQRDPAFRRGFEYQFAAHGGDFLAPSPGNYMLNKVDSIEESARIRGVENRLFPGFVGLALAGIGIVVLVVRVRSRRTGREPPDTRPPGTRWALALLLGAGVLFLVLSFGDWTVVNGHRVTLPFALVRKLPGFNGVRVTARFVIIPLLAMALLGAAGLAALLRRTGRTATAVVVILLCGAIVAETAQRNTLVEVPTDAEFGAVSRELAGRKVGPVVELPIGQPRWITAWGFVEAPRMYVAVADGMPRVNGYSGFFPPGYPELAAAISEFPAPESLARLDELGVLYVALRFDGVGNSYPDIVDDPGIGRYTRAEARRRLDAIPPERVADAVEVDGAYVVELTPP